MKETIKKNKKTLVIILLLLLVLVLASTYAWLRLTKNSNTVNKITAGNLDIVLDEGNSITLKNEVPRSYRQGMETTEYTFTLTNNSSLSNYKISLKDINEYVNEGNNEKVTITAENRIDDSKIRYILLKDGEEASANKSKILTDRILDSGTIEKGQTIKYSLRVWIDSRAGDNNTESEVMGKIFGVRLSLIAEQTSNKIIPTAKTICKRATTLHTEECNNGRCVSDGYEVSGSKGTTTITYGNLGTEGTLTSGDAFDCDVNGDGVYDSTTERFYYVSDYYNTSTKNFEEDTAVLVYYNNVSGGLPLNSATYLYDESGRNSNGPVTAIKQLPTTTQWSNVKLKNTVRTILTNTLEDETNNGKLPTAFSYDGYATRLITTSEIGKGCGFSLESTGAAQSIKSCLYLLENTYYSNRDYKRHWWTETPVRVSPYYIWGVQADYSEVNWDMANYNGDVGVRPVIEVAKTNIEY